MSAARSYRRAHQLARPAALCALKSAPRLPASSPVQRSASAARALCVQAPGGGSSREKNMWDGGGEATGVTPSSPNYGGPSAAAERFAVESTATATALQNDKPPPSLSIDLPENWWHGSADAPPPEHSDMGTRTKKSRSPTSPPQCCQGLQLAAAPPAGQKPLTLIPLHTSYTTQFSRLSCNGAMATRALRGVEETARYGERT
ncbi:hypothetical protein EMIHUDRAFT_373712 [Emiliania huxleyi CCMP1516]|uniref:Uncharacterized protein n=2 Tax=Emiliania huxleyi TaxID=2903 RepID=A0A0D3JVR0_EMIH1|nr:hypothetical protein EMIHUDRAFT_373712 [Emiliania huxleyi CCMP1516]EOD27595.1 hypothetical protein EMIHUDRAFT_373712 [Emiliania huxleyi CCMP1516]|eukprot:XP_005780024.1 hypothetical protein EMIHUDRAFT_373712 [Emiliania huxleyi CCMP1516]